LLEYLAQVPAVDSQITEMLRRWSTGDREVESVLFSRLHKELRKLAGHYLRRERADHTLQPTALVHEAYLRILGSGPVNWQDRSHFMCLASRAMRRVLVDHARARQAAKRSPLPEGVNGLAGPFSQEASAEVLAVHAALDKLAAVEPRQAHVVEMRYFGGLSFEEVAQALKISPRTAKRDWHVARLTLHDWISGVAS
jgi:RNA polymerase sigma factor (TIGR02999 family)